MKELRTSVLMDGLIFPKGLCWHNEHLWLSDMVGRKVYKIGQDGAPKSIADVANHPSGLGFLPDDTLLIVSMDDRRILRWQGEHLTCYADLSDCVSTDLNDIVVASSGRAYVGNYGFGRDWKSAHLSLVWPDRDPQIVASDLHFPNGCVITNDGSSLIVAETFSNILTIFDVSEDGQLENRRLFADLKDVSPDGICLNPDGAVWVAAAERPEFLLVEAGGEILARVSIPERQAVSCALGGADGQDLFCSTVDQHYEAVDTESRSGRIEVARVDHAR